MLILGTETALTCMKFLTHGALRFWIWKIPRQPRSGRSPEGNACHFLSSNLLGALAGEPTITRHVGIKPKAKGSHHEGLMTSSDNFGAAPVKNDRRRRI